MYESLISYIESQIDTDGFLKSYAISGKEVRQIHTPFFSYLAASVLQAIHEPSAYKLLDQLASRVIFQASTTGTYNYWTRNSPKSKTQHLPDDSDDTALAIAALSFSNNQTWSIPLATFQSCFNEGKFQTWIVSGNYLSSFPRWSEHDAYVNLNILYALGLNNILLPEVWIQTTQKYEPSKYYLPNGIWEFLVARVQPFYPEIPAVCVAPVSNPSLTTSVFTLATRKFGGGTIDKSEIKSLIEQFLLNPYDPCILGWQKTAEIPTYDCSPALIAVLLLFAYPAESEANVITASKLSATDFGKELISLPREVNPLLPGYEQYSLAEQNLEWWEYYYPYDAQVDGHSATVPKKRPARRTSSPTFTGALKYYLTNSTTPQTPKGWIAYFSSQHAPYIAAVLEAGGVAKAQSYTHYLIAKQLADDLIDLPEDITAKRESYATQYHKKHMNTSKTKQHISHIILYELSKATDVPILKTRPIKIAALRTLRILREDSFISAHRSSIPSGTP